jgi:hypothetical protein
MPDKGWRRRFDDPILVEGHADLLRSGPDDVAGNVRAVRLKDQVETLGEVEGVRMSAAPEMDMFRIRQFIVLPANSIAPDINTDKSRI